VRTVFPGEGRGLWEMAIGPDGTAWAAGSWGPELDGIATFDGETWVPTYDLPPGYNPFGDRHQVEIAPDGTMWAATEKGLARLDGETWTVVSAAPAGPIAFAPDGSVVAAVEEPSEVVTVRRFDGETWTTLGPGSGLGMKALAVAPDGTVWAANFSLFFGSISRFDGSAWTTWVPWGAAVVGSAWTSVRFDNGGGLDAPVEAALREAAIGEAGLGPTDMFVGFVPALTVATDGTAWATVKGGAPGVAALVRIEGDEWTFFPFAERAHGRFACLPPTPEAGLAIGPDGRVWVNRPCTRGVLYSFDGTTWRRGRGTPNSEREITAFEVAPDGTLWVASEESLVRFVSRAG
jgi:hypothetical protein